MAFGLQLVPAEHHLDGMSRALQRGRKLPERLDTAEGKPWGALLPSYGSSFSTLCTAKWTLPTPTFITPAQAADKNSSGSKVLAHVCLNQAPGCRTQGKASSRWDEAAKKEHLPSPLHSGLKQGLTLHGARTTFGINFC